eukprot:7074866-Prymnesium_polylepis.1
MAAASSELLGNGSMIPGYNFIASDDSGGCGHACLATPGCAGWAWGFHVTGWFRCNGPDPPPPPQVVNAWEYFCKLYGRMVLGPVQQPSANA